MGSDRRNKFEELKEYAGCANHLSCIAQEVRNMCDSNTDLSDSQLECLECKTGVCDFLLTSGVRAVCSCPLRNYIVKDFEGFIIDSADRIRRVRD